MKTKELQFLGFLAYCLNDKAEQLPDVTGMDWEKLYVFCQQQAIVGIVLSGIDRVIKEEDKGLNIPKGLLLEWIGQLNIIEKRNNVVNKRIKDLVGLFNSQRIRSCILKGQGNALMYPNPSLRTPGDIDIWLDGSKKEIADFIHEMFPDVIVAYHHMEFPVFDDVEVEVHYLPSYSYCFIHNNRLQAFFKDNSEDQFDNLTSEGFAVPTKIFNLVFQLSHMMRHFFTQGIGLRHAIDYYYLLKQGISDEEEVVLEEVLKQCGMYKFFLSMLWIEIEVLGLHVEYNRFHPEEKAGRLILNEMLKGGNFGKQYNHWNKNTIINYYNQFIYNLRYIREFPIEPISRPITLLVDYVRRHVFRIF